MTLLVVKNDPEIITFKSSVQIPNNTLGSMFFILTPVNTPMAAFRDVICVLTPFLMCFITCLIVCFLGKIFFPDLLIILDHRKIQLHLLLPLFFQPKRVFLNVRPSHLKFC